MIDWLPILVMLFIGIGFAIASLGVSYLLSPKNPTPANLTPYESGIFPEEESFNLDSLQTKGYNVFVLLDKECHIRGYFDSFTTKRLEGDIRMLKKEEGHTAYYGKE